MGVRKFQPNGPALEWGFSFLPFFLSLRLGLGFITSPKQLAKSTKPPSPLAITGTSHVALPPTLLLVAASEEHQFNVTGGGRLRLLLPRSCYAWSKEDDAEPPPPLAPSSPRTMSPTWVSVMGRKKNGFDEGSGCEWTSCGACNERWYSCAWDG